MGLPLLLPLAAALSAQHIRDKATNPSRGAKSRNRGRGGRNVVDRGRRSHVVGDAEMSGGSGKLRGGSSTFSNDNAKQPDLSSSAHFPPLPGLFLLSPLHDMLA